MDGQHAHVDDYRRPHQLEACRLCGEPLLPGDYVMKCRVCGQWTHYHAHRKQPADTAQGE